MENKEALDEFIWQLQKSFNAVTLYTKDHPYFLKPLEALKAKSEALFNFLSELRISVTPQAIFIDNQKLDKSGWAEIANGIHRHKIKAIIIKNSVSLEDYVCFFSAIALRPQEVLMAGGINQIIKGKVSGISIEELDYSQLLNGEGKEIKDIWTYLMREAVSEKSAEKILEVADSFKRILGQFKIHELLDDEQARDNITAFLEYLKTNRKDKLVPCMQEILRSVISEKNTSESEKLTKIMAFLNDLSGHELADTLFESISGKNQFDMLNLKLFFQLIDERKHKDIASSFYEKLQSRDYFKEAPQIKKRIQDLFSVSDGSSISEIYRSTLSNLLKSLSFENKFSFDRKTLQSNYRFMLLELLDAAEDPENFNSLLERVSAELANVFNERDWGFVKYLFGELKKKGSDLGFDANALDAFMRELVIFVEDSVWGREISPEFRYLLKAIDRSYRGPEFYLEKIFKENIILVDALSLFFRFFPSYFEVFVAKLEEKEGNLDFIAQVIECLKSVEPIDSLKVYKRMFYFSNEFVKLEILRAMRELSDMDTEFLLSVLRHESLLLRKEAFNVSGKNAAARKKAIEALLKIKSQWGRNNRLILDNLSIVEEASAKEAKQYVESIAERRFFWNWNVSSKAREILKEWA